METLLAILALVLTDRHSAVIGSSSGSFSCECNKNISNNDIWIFWTRDSLYL